MRWRVWLILFIFPLFSGELEERVTALEAQMGEVGEETSEGTFGASFAPETFQKGWIGLFFSGEALFWHVKVGGSEYAYSLAQKALDLPQSGEVESQSFDWGVGYRFGVGVRLPILGWNLAGIYTHFGTEDREANASDCYVNLKSRFTSPTDSIQSRYKIDYDCIDLELRSSSFLSRFFGIETFWGLRNAWIDQLQGIYYSELQVKDRCRFQGMGPRLGGRLQWHLLYGASFLTAVTGSLLYGDFEVKYRENLVNLKGNSHLFSANVSFLIGLGWDVYGNWYHWGVTLGYEAEYYFRQNRMIEVEGLKRVQIVRNVDDLTFYGVTIKALVEF